MKRQRLGKRLIDITLSSGALVALSPMLLFLALLVKVSSHGPVLFRQQRVGRDGRLFWILKFRSMTADAERFGPGITSKGDPRVTKVGAILRRMKLDELPQFWNVLRGEMSLVGPRPEVPKYVARYSEAQRAVLHLTPGLTDLATLTYRDEERLLSDVADKEQYYVENLMPKKIELNLLYAQRANSWEDLKLLLKTCFRICWPAK